MSYGEQTPNLLGPLGSDRRAGPDTRPVVAVSPMVLLLVPENRSIVGPGVCGKNDRLAC